MKIQYFRFTLLFVFGFLLNAFPQSKKLWIETADKSFKEKDFITAVFYYKKALDDTLILKTATVLPYEIQMVNMKLKKDSVKKVTKDSIAIKIKDTIKQKAIDLKNTATFDYVLFQLAQSYRLNADYTNAVEAYKKCADRNIYPDSRYYYAISLMHVKKYQDALNEFEKYISSKPENDSLGKIAEKKEAGCYMALDSTNVNKEIRVDLLDTMVFNKGTCSFAAMYYLSPTKIIFTSARKGGVITDPKKQVSEYLCDLYWTEYKDSAWTKAINFGPPLNSAVHEGGGYVTPDEVMLFSRWNDISLNESFIYKAKMINGKFFQAQKLSDNINLMGYKSMHPFVTFDGTKLFFSSNRPGGKGGFDLWMCTLDENGNPSSPKNLGAPVNTSGDEVSPFFHSLSNILYFSSNGLAGLGGLDVFKSEYNADDNVYSIPKNLNAPVNSSKDDAYYIMDRTQGRGFFSSDRAECEGGNCYKIYEFINQPIKFDISGIVFDGQTNEPMAGAMITIKDLQGDAEPVFVFTDDKGNYFSELKAGADFFMKAQKNKYFGDAANVTTKGLTQTAHLQQDFNLNTIPKGEIEIEGIEYDFNSAGLRPKSMANLDKIVDLLKVNDNLAIDINANTDSRGNDAYNMKLSQARAQSCVDYIISKGIDGARLHPKGYGETDPLVKEVEIKKMKPKSPEFEAAHQKNRRTALKVVGESKITIINKGK